MTHVDLVTRGPGSAERKDVDNLHAAGLSSHAIVSLSQLIAYVNFQSRVLAGLRMLKGAIMSKPPRAAHPGRARVGRARLWWEGRAADARCRGSQACSPYGLDGDR